MSKLKYEIFWTGVVSVLIALLATMAITWLNYRTVQLVMACSGGMKAHSERINAWWIDAILPAAFVLGLALAGLGWLLQSDGICSIAGVVLVSAFLTAGVQFLFRR